MGLLIAKGVIPLDQFWPRGQSDADTTKVVVSRFEYEGRRTEVFAGAVVHGQQRPNRVVSAEGVMTVRWQGADAPELHYRPSSSTAKAKGPTADFREHLGETCAVALSEHLAGLARGAGEIACEVRTRVDHPNDVFDTYGRFIGEVWIGGRNLNLWLVRNGLAFPTFYASLQADEIREYRAASRDAAARKRGIWSSVTRELRFDPELVYRRGGAKAVQVNDRGPVVFPKLFRRLAACFVALGSVAARGLNEYLERHCSDYCYLTEEFLEQGQSAARPYRLSQFVRGRRFTRGAGELVFKEAGSTIVDGRGRVLGGW